jgi:exonuclease VII small subunit
MSEDDRFLAALQALIDILTEFAETGQSAVDMQEAARSSVKGLVLLQEFEKQVARAEARHESMIQWLEAVIAGIRSGEMGLDEVLIQLEQRAELDDDVQMEIDAEKDKREGE